MTTITINDKKLADDQIWAIQIGLSEFLDKLNDPTKFTNEEVETKYKTTIDEIFEIMKDG